MMKVTLTTIVVTGIFLSSLSGAAYAQGTFASVSAEAGYRIPAVDGDLKAYLTVADFAAAGYQSSVSAESRSNSDDNPDNVAKSEAFFSESPTGLGVAKGYNFSGARYSKYPVDVYARSQISSQFTLRVTQDRLGGPVPFDLKAYLPVHGTFGAFDFSQQPESAIASAFTGVRVQTTNYDVTHKGTVTVRSTVNSYNPDIPSFTVEATDDFVNSVTIRNDLPNPEGYEWTTFGAELSQLLVYDLPIGFLSLSGEEDFNITFLQEITSSLKEASFKFAYADLRSTTGFEIVAVDPTTGQRLDGVINVQLVGAGGPTAAPEPASLAFLCIIALPFAAVRIVRRRTSSLQ